MESISNLENRIHKIWWVPMITGIIAFGLGVWCFFSPESSLTVFAYAFSVGLIIAGLLNLCYSVASRKLHTNWGWSLVLGLLEVGCGIWLCTLPAESLAISFAYAAGIWMLVVAINSIGEAVYFSRYSTAWTVWMVIVLIATILCVVYFLFNPVATGVFGWIWIGFSLELFGIWRVALALKLRRITH